MPAAFTSAVPSRGRCLSARYRRVAPSSSRVSWIDSSKRVCSGVAFAVFLQLSGTADCARALDDTVTVPRGALEDLILRDLSHRIREMDPDSLSSFMQSLKGISAPDPRAERPMDSKPSSGSEPSTGESSKAEASPTPSPVESVQRERLQGKAMPALPSPLPREAPEALPDKQTMAPEFPEVVPPPRAPREEPTYSIFRDTPSSSSPAQADDLTAQLLGLRPAPDDTQPRPRTEATAREEPGPQEAWLGILGLPLAVWTTLDKVLPAELRSTSGEVLTEEVVRAVYVVKGLVLFASAALAYFLSRALLAQLRAALLAVPLAQQALQAFESTADAAQRVQPEVRQRAAALLSRLPGGADGRGSPSGGADGQPDADQRQGAGAASAMSDALPRGGVLAGGAREAAGMAPPGNGAGPRPPAASPPPLPLVPTASGALYTTGQVPWDRSSGAQRRPRAAAAAPAAARPSGDAGGAGAAPGDAVPLPVIDEVELLSAGSARVGSQRGGGAAPAGGEGPGGGVLWKRGGSRPASVLSSRWDEGGAGSAVGSGGAQHDESPAAGRSRSERPLEDASGPPEGADDQVGRVEAPANAGHAGLGALGEGQIGFKHAHIDSGLGTASGKPRVGSTAPTAAAEKDPWFG